MDLEQFYLQVSEYMYMAMRNLLILFRFQWEHDLSLQLGWRNHGGIVQVKLVGDTSRLVALFGNVLHE